MKKFILVLMAFVTAQSAFALLPEAETSSIDVLKKQGYSTPTLEIVDKTKEQVSVDQDYKPYYTHKRSGKKLGKIYTLIKDYVDPAQDDGKFMEHEINFTNTWNDDVPEWSLSKEHAVENL